MYLWKPDSSSWYWYFSPKDLKLTMVIFLVFWIMYLRCTDDRVEDSAVEGHTRWNSWSSGDICRRVNALPPSLHPETQSTRCTLRSSPATMTKMLTELRNSENGVHLPSQVLSHNNRNCRSSKNNNSRCFLSNNISPAGNMRTQSWVIF